MEKYKMYKHSSKANKGEGAWASCKYVIIAVSREYFYNFIYQLLPTNVHTDGRTRLVLLPTFDNSVHILR